MYQSALWFDSGVAEPEFARVVAGVRPRQTSHVVPVSTQDVRQARECWGVLLRPTVAWRCDRGTCCSYST
jgi:hypothetical protein